MKYFLPVLTFLYISAFAQQRENTVAISCYANPELYMQAGIIAFVSDKAGNVSCKGSYISIYNGSKNFFYYKQGTGWAEVKPKRRTIATVSKDKTGGGSLSILSLSVKYRVDKSGDISAKIKAMARMNAQSDRIKAGESGEVNPKPGKTNLQAERALIIANKPIAFPENTPVKTPLSEPKTQPKNAGTKNKKIPKSTPSNAPKPEQEAVELTEIENDTIPSALLDSADYAAFPCFLSDNVSYYTFFFAEVKGDMVFYTDPFPVARYDNSGEAERLLSKAWGCLSERIIQQFGEDRYNDMLNDVDNDLHSGILHLRETGITSVEITNNYPYSASLVATQAELRAWIDFNRKKNANIQFVKIRFP